MHITRFLSSCRASGLSPRTISFYAACLSRFSSFVGSQDWQSLDVSRSFVDALLSRSVRYADHPTRPTLTGNLSAHTVRGYVRTLRRFYNWLVEENVLTESPVRRLKLPKVQKQLPKAMDVSDFEAMLAVSSGSDRAILLFLRDTGCRVGELCNLRICDTNLTRGLAVVRGKTGERFAFLSGITTEAIRATLNKREIHSDSEPLFRSRLGVYSTKGVYKVLRRLAQRAHVSGRYNPHALRHSFARDWLLSGGDLASLSDVLGHSDLTTTKQYAAFAVGELQRLHGIHSPLADTSEWRTDPCDNHRR